MTAHATPDTHRDAARDSLTVCVNLTGGGWEITLPDQPKRMTCETLNDATRIAYLCAAHRRPCEVIIHDAYHRTLYHELINDRAEPSDTSSQRAPPLDSKYLTANSQIRTHRMSPGGVKH